MVPVDMGALLIENLSLFFLQGWACIRKISMW